MTIYRRILAGNLAVAGLLLAPAIYAVVRLGQMGERTRRSVETGLDTVRELDRLRSEFEAAAQVRRFSGAFTDDPDVREKMESTLAAARRTYSHVRPRLVGGEGAPSLARLDTLLVSDLPVRGPDRALSGATRQVFPEGASDSSLEEAPRLDSKEPGAVSSGAISNDPWSDEEADLNRAEISAADFYSRRRLLEETDDITKDAERAGQMGGIALLIIAPLALLSTFLVVLGIHRPLSRLISATSAVAAGEFGTELPVKGNDEISGLARAFNQMSASLAALDRMKADFINVVAHELKTPLTCIKGYAGALRATLPVRAQGGEASGYLDRIDREADLIARRVSELLTFGVIEAGQLKLERREVMTEGFLLMVAEAFRPIAAERRIDFVVDVDSQVPPTFTADPDRLNQVLLNLLDNAFKYTREGGQIRMEGRSIGGTLEVEIHDTGTGIPREQLETVFEKYARVRSDSGGGQGGTGLGLAVARGIVLAHGGTVDARSEPGRGSTFRVRLPLEPDSARRKEVA